MCCQIICKAEIQGQQDLLLYRYMQFMICLFVATTTTTTTTIFIIIVIYTKTKCTVVCPANSLKASRQAGQARYMNNLNKTSYLKN